MNLHSSAKACPFSRGILVRRVCRMGWTVKQAAMAAGDGGRQATRDAPVYRWPDLRRKGLSRWSALEKKEPPRRYEMAEPGGLLHLDIKKLGKIRGVGHRIHGDRRTHQRGIGWEHLHVAIDAHSRSSYAGILTDEKKETTAAFLQRALFHYASQGVQVRRILTDNGMCYHSKLVQAVCEAHAIKHSFTRPYRPQTNGKAERFIQTALREWAYRLAYESSEQRSQALKAWLHHYNHHGSHSALGGLTPAHKLNSLFGRDS